MKDQALVHSVYVRRPEKPIIGYLAREMAEEEKNAVGTQDTAGRSEPVGFIGLDDDGDHGLERAFGGFRRKG